MMKNAWRTCLLVSVFATLPAACTNDDGGPKRYPVSGTISFDGQPVATGELRFVSDDGKSYAEGAKIKDGRFSSTVTAGPKRIEVRATREDPTRMVPSAIYPGQMEPDLVEFVPARYNEKTELTAEVSPDKKNEYTFELHSDPPNRRKK